jgi:glycosyltransferase involved in cell wall biosynthesis
MKRGFMKTMALVSPGLPRCGIKDYSDFLKEKLKDYWHIADITLPDSTETKAWRTAAAQANRADLVLVHYEYGLFHSIRPYRNIFARFMHQLRLPIVVILHDLLPELRPRRGNQDSYRARDALRDLAYLPFFANWSRRLYNLADHYIVHAQPLYEKVRTLPFRVRVSRHQHPVPPISGRWHIEQQKKYTFITPGFIKPHKGYLDFLDGVKSHSHWSWCIAGSPQTDADQEFAGFLLARIHDLGLQARVKISGYQARVDLEKMMTRAEMAIFPYQRATGSGAVAWAVAMGMPVLTTDLDSFTALVQDGAGLILMPAKRPGLWPEFCESALRDTKRQAQLVAANMAFSTRHNYADTARQITAIGADLLRHPQNKKRGCL